MATNQGGNNKGNKQSNNESDTSNRGFASMDPQKQREIAAEGGRAAHASGHAHEFTSEEAREAGKLSHGGNQQSTSVSGNKQSVADSKSSSGGKSGSQSSSSSKLR